MTRRCANCTEHKDEAEFDFNKSRGYYSSYCKPCRRSRFKKTREQNTATMARYRAKNPERHRRYKLRNTLKKSYGLTLEQYDAMLAAQAGACAICSKPPPPGYRHLSRLHVDHCHATGKVRALLCSRCNNGLGCYGDDPAVVRLAADYLDRHRTA